ncbi:MAG TPA: transposase [Terriglobales bacterium]|nr:transposase [Terriglobales bacterium]
MMQHNHDELQTLIGSLVESHFPCLRRTVRKNLARLTGAFLQLAWGVRFGYGGLHLTSIARVLPAGKKFKSSYKWLTRFLKCKYFDASSLAQCMLSVILGNQPPSWVIVLVDQTTVNGVEVVNAAIPFQGRAVPVAWVDFEYPWKKVFPASQNTIERYLLTWLGLAVPPGVRLILVFDRGYARVELIKDLNNGQQPFLIRARRNVVVQTKLHGQRRWRSLGRLPHRSGCPTRYAHVLYHSQKAEPVDVIVYREKGFAEPWFLIVPPDSQSWLSSEDVVRLYRQRMQIEQCFRDWKSHLGLRGLHLQINRSERLLRVLMGFTLAYLLVLLLGTDPLAEKLRPYFEQERRKLRHGTRKVLSVLSIALHVLADPHWQQQARKRLMQILSRLAQGRGVGLLPAFSP